MPYKAFAAIDIGSHRLKMKIIEAAPDGRIKDLEANRSPGSPWQGYL